jgi:[ribosomal protein S5]-alanine N-acetyltransferase
MILTPRLKLISANAEMVRMAMLGSAELAEALQASVPDTWPHDFLDNDAFQYFIDRLTAAPETLPWWFYFVVLQDTNQLVGTAGFKGPPNAEGLVEIGYGIVSDQRRKGYASEAVQGLIDFAKRDPAVKTIIAETMPDLVGSIGVLATCGFVHIGDGSEPGAIRYQLV